MSDGFLPTACQETKPRQTSSVHRPAQVEVLHLNKRLVPAPLGLHWPVSSSRAAAQRRARSLRCSGSPRCAGWHWGVLGSGFGVLPPLRCPQLWTLGGCLCCVGCVSKPPSRPRNNHNLLLCVFLAQKRLIHSLKQINYFCYLEKKKKRNPVELVGLSFSCVYNAVKQMHSEPEQKSLHGKRSCGLQHLPGTSAAGFAI